MERFSKTTKKDQGSLLVDLRPLTLDPIWDRKGIFKSDAVEILAPASEIKELNIELDPSLFIQRLE